MQREILDEAYRKLKGSVYMDKTLPHIRLEIAQFENEKFDVKMHNLLESINDERKWEVLETSILNSIHAYTFPKKLLEEKIEKEEPIVISNVCSESVCVEKYNNFIDISIEGHIIGVLWILLVGHIIDKNLFENCFGNRLCDRLVFNNNQVSESPNLFKPYYEQYESWRNQGLECAKEAVNHDNQSVIITMLDLTRYYYNIDYSGGIFDRITECVQIEKSEVKRINTLIYRILERYSAVLGAKNKVLLPIGFLPSNILSNAYMQYFDKEASLGKNTIYYGRYVDDMILVTRIDPQSHIRSKISKNGVGEVSNYILKKLEEEELVKVREDETIELLGYKGLLVQKSKFRFFYLDKNGYDTIIEKIRRDISHNTSEFGFLPEQAVSDITEDILQFEREDTVNKLRAVNGVSIDKYALSKAIGKNVKMAQYAEDEAVNAFIKNLELLLNHREIINNYTQWEGVLNYYVLHEKWNKIIDFASKVAMALGELEEDSNKVKDYEYLNNSKIMSVGDTLIKFFNSCLTRSTAIVWGKAIQAVLEQVFFIFSSQQRYTRFVPLFEKHNITKNRRYFCNARMINRRLLPVSIEECMKSFTINDNNIKVECLFKLDKYLVSNKTHKYTKGSEKYAPYITSPFDILFTSLLKEIKDGKEELNNDDYCVKKVCREYAANFVSDDKGYLLDQIRSEAQQNNNCIISVETQSKHENNGKYRIAIANVKMRLEDLHDILDEKKRDISNRCSEISKIINEAINNKSDVLVFPEAYIPIEYLPVVQMKAAEHNMVIIGGIEHVRRKKLIYNLTVTLIPAVNSKARYTIPFFHTKVFYSPEEEKEIKLKKCIPVEGKGHTMFSWKGLSFVSFCCFELTSLEERSKFKREADIVFGVEWNKDTIYFSNIMEALSRDRCCFCAQSNMSVYGDSRIIQPTKSEKMNIARVKGGINGTVIIDEIDVYALRKHRNKPEKDDGFKPLPAGY